LRCRLFQDVRSDPDIPHIARFREGADPRERPVRKAEPIYRVEIHVLVICKRKAKPVSLKYQGISNNWILQMPYCRWEWKFFYSFYNGSTQKQEKLFT
jgi:hypothetical protein